MIAIGVDVHKRQCTVAMQREDGELGCFGPMENTREGWRELLEQLPPEAEIALEAGSHGMTFMPWACHAVRRPTAQARCRGYSLYNEERIYLAAPASAKDKI